MVAVSTIAERVAAGAAWLDEQMPNWWNAYRIDLSKFDMAAGCGCVIGQLYPAEGYEVDEDDEESPFEHAIETGWLDLDERAAIVLGFYATTPHTIGGTAREYDRLTTEWRRVITERRAAA